MKLHFLFILMIFISSCNFFSKKETNKDKAKALFSEITTRQAELEPKIEHLIEIGNTPPKKDMSKAEIQLTAIGYSIGNFYENWTKGFENYKKQEIYMNYDLQLKRLESFEKVLDKMDLLILKADSLMVVE